MTFLRKFNGKTERPDNTSPVVCTYTCPEHGEFDCEVQRNENGEAPDEVECGAGPTVMCAGAGVYCSMLARWTPTPVASRVRRFEVTRGKWEKPERPTYLDTRKLGEGQSMEDFRAERKAVWEEKRKQDVMNVKKGFG